MKIKILAGDKWNDILKCKNAAFLNKGDMLIRGKERYEIIYKSYDYNQDMLTFIVKELESYI